jgi:hypothetical protein
LGVWAGPDGETTIDATGRASDTVTLPDHASEAWAAVSAWAHLLAGQIATEQPAQHVAIFVPDEDGAGLRLAAQIWGAGEDTSEVVAGDWLIPLEGSVCGRVYRTGLATLCADVSMDPDYRAFPGGRTRSSLTVPVGPPDRVVAVINLEAPWVGAFAIRDYDRMTELAAGAHSTFPEPPSA